MFSAHHKMYFWIEWELYSEKAANMLPVLLSPFNVNGINRTKLSTNRSRLLGMSREIAELSGENMILIRICWRKLVFVIQQATSW